MPHFQFMKRFVLLGALCLSSAVSSAANACEVVCRSQDYCGDLNRSGSISTADIIFLVNYVMRGGPGPELGCGCADVNDSGAVSSADIIALVNFVFREGEALTCPAVPHASGGDGGEEPTPVFK